MQRRKALGESPQQIEPVGLMAAGLFVHPVALLLVEAPWPFGRPAFGADRELPDVCHCELPELSDVCLAGLEDRHENNLE